MREIFRKIKTMSNKHQSVDSDTESSSAHLLPHVVLEEDLLDLGGDHVGVEAAGQGRHLIQTGRGWQQRTLEFILGSSLHSPPEVGGKTGGRSSIIFCLCEARGSRRLGAGCERLGSDPNLRPEGSTGALSNWGLSRESGTLRGGRGGSPAAT